MDCVFCNIANKKIEKEFDYEDEDVMVFEDLFPVKPIHLLVVPKKHVEDFTKLDDVQLTSKLWQTVSKMIKDKDLTDKGVRIVINSQGAQIVPHLHIHIMGPVGKAVTV